MTPEQREGPAHPKCPFCNTAPRYLAHKAGFYEEKVICDTCDFSLPPTLWNRRAQVEALTVPQVYPMSTAPHDGTEVLAWSKTGKTWHQVYWKTQENGDWLFLPSFPPRWACRWNEAYYQGQAEFSHWTPIPASPTIPAIPGTKEGA